MYPRFIYTDSNEILIDWKLYFVPLSRFLYFSNIIVIKNVSSSTFHKKNSVFTSKRLYEIFFVVVFFAPIAISRCFVYCRTTCRVSLYPAYINRIRLTSFSVSQNILVSVERRPQRCWTPCRRPARSSARSGRLMSGRLPLLVMGLHLVIRLWHLVEQLRTKNLVISKNTHWHCWINTCKLFKVTNSS